MELDRFGAYFLNYPRNVCSVDGQYPSTLSRQFNKEKGMTLSDYQISEKKIEFLWTEYDK